MPEQNPLIEAQNLSLREQERTLLDQVSLTLSPRRIVTVIGPNGAGKTTLVRLLLGLRSPSEGQIIRRPGLRIGYVPQKLDIDASLPIRVDRFLGLGGRCSPEERHRALDEVGVREREFSPLRSLSGGEFQRVLMARALLRRPDLLVLDEPAQGVDLSGQREMYALIRGLRDRLGCGVLLVSHDLHLVMAATDEVLCIEGHVCCRGQPEDVSRHPEYQRLFGGELTVYTHHHDHEHGLDGQVHACGASCAHTAPAPLSPPCRKLKNEGENHG
ncbi:MAG: metal ABC transporter ATP-binding protein [Pseudomonadota bacterium]